MLVYGKTAVYKDNKIYLDLPYLDVLTRVMSIENEIKILYAAIRYQ